MKLNELQKAYDDRFDLITRLLQYIEYAKANHLDVEFMDSFLQEYLVDQNIGMSIRHAAREWDL